jgi:steroid delta-isomerase-like uncharacterized protein
MNSLEVVRRFYEAFNERDEKILDEVIADDYIDYGHSPAGRGKQGAKSDFRNLLKSFNPINFDIDEMFSVGDRVVVRWTGRGLNVGPLGGIPATDKQATIRGMSIYRLRDGKIAETRNSVDLLTTLVDLGVVQVPSKAA